MKVMKPMELLVEVGKLRAKERLIYFNGAFAFLKEIHENTDLGRRLEALSELALWLEEERQIFLFMNRIEDFNYTYIAIKRSECRPISDYIINQVREAQNEFDSNNWIQGLRKIRGRKLSHEARIRQSQFR